MRWKQIGGVVVVYVMGLTRVRGADSVARGDHTVPSPEVKKVNETRTCVSVLDGGLANHDKGNERFGAEIEDEAKRDDAVGWSGNQFGEDLDRVPPHMTSRLAALNRELKALEVRYFRTRLQLEKSMDKVRQTTIHHDESVVALITRLQQNNQLRVDMTKLRGHATKLERETCKLRNLVLALLVLG